MRIVIVGAGFAGLSAARGLRRVVKEAEILLFDKNSYTTMLPSLPDLAGDKLPRQMLIEQIQKLLPPGIEFRNESVQNLELSGKTLLTDTNRYSYDYLIITSGSVTNLYGFDKHQKNIYKLDSLAEASRIQERFIEYIKRGNKLNVVLSGAGYTGLELACSLRHLARNLGRDIDVTLAEMADDILPFLNNKERDYIKSYLGTLNIRLMLNSRITDYDGHNVTINKGHIIEDAFFCWTAGSQSAVRIKNGNADTIPDGRIVVNRFLQISSYPEVFAAGDAAAIHHRGAFLRKAVNFSIGSGKHAGKNLVRLIKNQKLKVFNPVDLGWVIPLHEISVGKVLGKIRVRGKSGLRLHYFMCGYRNYNLKNFVRYIKVALKPF